MATRCFESAMLFDASNNRAMGLSIEPRILARSSRLHAACEEGQPAV